MTDDHTYDVHNSALVLTLTSGAHPMAVAYGIFPELVIHTINKHTGIPQGEIHIM